MNIAVLYLILYFVALAIITWISSRRKTVGEYINSAKNLSAAELTWTTFASLLTGYNFVIGVTFAYLYGFWYLFVFIGAGIAFIVLYFFYKKRLVALQKNHDLLSIGDYFGIQYGSLSKNFVNLILCGGLLLFLILQLFVNTGLFSALLHIEKIPALLLTAGVVCVYLWLGGFKASVKTDIFQGFLMLPIILTIFVFPFHFTLEKIPTAFDPSQFWFAIGLALLQFFNLLGQAESFQRVFASRDVQSLKKGLSIAFILLALVAGSIAYLGINFKFAGITTDPSNLFTEGVLFALPEWLGSLLIVSLIAAFMGTIDSSAFAFGVLVARMRKTNEETVVKSTRLFTLLGIFISALASLYLFSFLSSVFALISLISIIGAALLISFIFKLNSLEINSFLFVGTVVFVLGLIFKFVNDNPLTSLIPSGAALVAFLAVRGYQKLFIKPFLFSK
jgi:Na+/proline symporter